MSKHTKILAMLSVVLLFSFVIVSLGIAYAGGVRGLGLVGICFFLTFGLLLVLAQLIPAGILLFCMITTGFSSLRRGEVPVHVS